MDPTDRLKKHWTSIAAAVLCILGFAGKTVVSLRVPLDSDDSLPIMLIYSMLEDKCSFLKGWHLQPNNYLFTDFPFHILTYLLAGDGALAVRTGSLTIYVLSVLFLCLSLKKAFGTEVALLSMAALLSAPLSASSIMLRANIHIGTVMFGFVVLYAITYSVESDLAPSRISIISAIVFFISALAAFSDMYFIFISACPFIAVAVWMKLTSKSAGRRAHVVLLGNVAGIGVGMALTKLTSHIGLSLYQNPTDFISMGDVALHFMFAFKSAARLLNLTVSDGSIFIKTAYAVNLVFILATISLLPSALKGENNRTRMFALHYLVFLTLIMFAAFTFKYKFLSFIMSRYLVPIVYSLPALAVLAASIYCRRTRKIMYALLAVWLLSNSYQCLKYKPDSAAAGRLKEIADFLAEKGLHYGYASYNHANVITMLSNNRVKVRSIGFDYNGLTRDYWVSRSGWYLPSAHVGKTFLMVPDGDLKGAGASTFSMTMGTPSETYRCRNVTIYVWPYNIIETTLPSINIDEKTFHSVGRIVSREGQKILAAEKGERGLLMYGPYLALNEGRYRVNYFLMSDGDPTVSAARLEVTAIDLRGGNKQPTVLGFKNISASNGVLEKHSVDFDAQGSDDLSYEFRVESTGLARLSVYRLTLERLKQ